eukprot:418481-Alexandrium_andersonii.AAC.1
MHVLVLGMQDLCSCRNARHGCAFHATGVLSICEARVRTETTPTRMLLQRSAGAKTDRAAYKLAAMHKC